MFINHRKIGELALARIPRYVRVNTLLWTTEAAIHHYEKQGFQISDPFSSEYTFRFASITSLFTSSQEIIRSRPACPRPLAFQPPHAISQRCPLQNGQNYLTRQGLLLSGDRARPSEQPACCSY